MLLIAVVQNSIVGLEKKYLSVLIFITVYGFNYEKNALSVLCLFTVHGFYYEKKYFTNVQIIFIPDGLL